MFLLIICEHSASTMYLKLIRKNINVAVCNNERIAIFLWKNGRLCGNI